jgi:uncharacterized protein (TIGR00725 family)
VSPRAAYVGVIGASAATEEEKRIAEAVGRGVAAGGAVLVCGGQGGVMEAACRGACAEGGRTVGILPGLDRADANAWVEVAIATGLGELRNGLIVRASDALIAIGGEFGTLSEIALALRDSKPVVGIGTWDLERRGSATQGIVAASDPAAAVQRAFSLMLA